MTKFYRTTTLPNFHTCLNIFLARLRKAGVSNSHLASMTVLISGSISGYISASFERMLSENAFTAIASSGLFMN